jgi:hypothetical protein
MLVFGMYGHALLAFTRHKIHSVKIMNKLPKDRGMEYFEISTFKKSKEHLRDHTTLDSEFAYIGKKTLKNSII